LQSDIRIEMSVESTTLSGEVTEVEDSFEYFLDLLSDYSVSYARI